MPYRQGDPGLNPISTWGCGFIAEHAMWEVVSGIILTVRQLLEIWLKNWVEGDVDSESTMENWQGVLEDFLAFGGPKMEYLGHRPATYIPADNEEEILWFERADGYRHFVYGRYDKGLGRDVVVWDPTEQSVTVSTGWIIGKRIFRISR